MRKFVPSLISALIIGAFLAMGHVINDNKIVDVTSYAQTHQYAWSWWFMVVVAVVCFLQQLLRNSDNSASTSSQKHSDNNDQQNFN